MRINKKYEALPFSMQEIGPLIKDFISKEKQVAITVTGNSMSPFLKDKRDKAVLSPITKKPKKDDVVLYLRDNGTYVLHRIFKVCIRCIFLICHLFFLPYCDLFVISYLSMQRILKEHFAEN